MTAPELPADVRDAATQLRAVFGDGVRLVRVTGAVELGNPKWDWYCREVDGEQDV